MRRDLLRLIFALVFVMAAVTVASAQDFQQSYRIGAGGSIRIQSVSGDIKMTGYDGDAITVSGFKEGRDRQQVEIEDLSGGNRVEVRVRYPRDCNCDASVRFEVRVPRSVNYNFDKISTASGNIEMSGLTGQLKAHTASGDVLISNVTGPVDAATASGTMRVKDVTGTVSARSASGDVEVEIARLEGADNMDFSSASGDVTVKLPANLDGEVDMSSATGSLRTDFPLEVKSRRNGPGEWARGRLGNSSRMVRISSASGDVSLLKF
jgi:DUF4097 and DUF4098 domain-containing protein YvlB